MHRYIRRTSGAHLGAIHRWIQTRFLNGDTVTWGSQDKLCGEEHVTPELLEEAAQVVNDALLRKFAEFVKRHFKVCLVTGAPEDDFEPDPDRPMLCKKCGHRQEVHKLLDIRNGIEGSDFHL